MHGDQDGLQGDFIEGALNYLEAYKSALLPRTIQPSHVIESWCAPPPPRININFDVGFFEDNYFQVAAVARDLEGRCVWWRARRFIGQPASVVGEARAALEGVKLAVDTGWGGDRARRRKFPGGSSSSKSRGRPFSSLLGFYC